ncbi:MAG: hypothetical protein JSW39_18855 [Desulfobacterales bacterium]|nr:MAG: hypothetical protein JSW39_18855 [Desulfobacterales bacterium]
MDFSNAHAQFVSRARQAYENFVKHKIPFAAVKISVSGLCPDEEKLAKIIQHNFRTAKDVVVKNDKAYAVLMENTTIEAAEKASSRLKTKLGSMLPGDGESERSEQVLTSVYILGSSQRSTKLQFRNLDLSSPLRSPKEDIETGIANVREYLKWVELPKHTRFQAVQGINIKI